MKLLPNYIGLMDDFRIGGKEIDMIKQPYLNEIRDMHQTNKIFSNQYMYFITYKEPRIKDLVILADFFNDKNIPEILYEKVEYFIRPSRNKDFYFPIIKYINNDLAYLLGVICGDGGICKNTYEITITFSKEERRYADYIKNLILKIFKIKSKIYNVPRAIRLKIEDKILHTLLTKVIGLPTGKKKNLSIPDLLKDDPELLKNFISGFFDTDGSIFMRTGRNYPRVRFYQKSTEILKNIQNFLDFIDIKSNFGCDKRTRIHTLTIDKKESTIKFCRIIKSRHTRKNRVMRSFLN